ncbi:MAG: AEC family transporter [Victivallales bacterium]|nr:AEC family transporter [Victivallales bacterium]
MENQILRPVLEAIIEIFGMFAIGALLRKLKFIDKEDLSKFSSVVFDVLFPIMIFASIATQLKPDRICELWMLPLIGFLMMLLGWILGWGLRYGMQNRGNGRTETFHHFCIVNNYIFLPLIVISNLWGETYEPLLFLFNVGSTIGLWTIGIGVLTGSDLKRAVKNILSPNLLAVFLGFIVVWLQIPLPGVVLKVANKSGGAAVPLILLLIGATLWGNIKNIFDDKWDICYLTLCRLILIPLINIWIIKMIPMPLDIYRVAFVVSIMPVSVNTSVLTLRYGGNPELAGQAAVITTVVSIVTIPLLLYLL